MSHVKAGGATRQGSTRPGKRRGLKKYGGEVVKTGQIIIRQVGTRTRGGVGVGMGRDYTLFAMRDGIVTFFTRLGKSFVTVK
ncbi:50S ribosomal protein L27 [Candidatus Collierbacteria bacterium CG10_big_fil_rev_8_21_14_0_10_44_9]|uniref:Large ribosomal subunit protein bL27 n=1 Tax=Candidatus Collierbacteria bacterium CG10_big_fil_rev_8_21_14_0_10_44_9 TaxID=1974535 RepID=A0A2H0VKJ6_9BACT|nr:MAG: 50S ribosomal protein L27 [Candidatus Collierbacteria bacterium CG10_big_fil_rev_8_21_14_0_10_44_9]